MNEVLIYQKDDGQTAVEVRLEQDTLWMSQAQMAELFDKDSDTIGLHLRNIYESGELNEDATTEESSVVRQEGKRQVRRTICFYNLDAVISVGYRVNSLQGTRFRIWANRVLKEYLVQGYALNTQRLQAQQEHIKQLERTLTLFQQNLIEQASLPEARGLVSVINNFMPAFIVIPAQAGIHV